MRALILLLVIILLGMPLILGPAEPWRPWFEPRKIEDRRFLPPPIFEPGRC